MQVVNQVKLELENYEKCHFVCDSDCPLGQLFDYACAVQAFIQEKMKAASEAAKPKEEVKE